MATVTSVINLHNHTPNASIGLQVDKVIFDDSTSTYSAAVSRRYSEETQIQWLFNEESDDMETLIIKASNVYNQSVLEANKALARELPFLKAVSAAGKQTTVTLNPGQPITVGFSFRIDPQLKEQFTTYCDEQNYNYSDVLRLLVTNFLQES